MKNKMVFVTGMLALAMIVSFVAAGVNYLEEDSIEVSNVLENEPLSHSVNERVVSYDLEKGVNEFMERDEPVVHVVDSVGGDTTQSVSPGRGKSEDIILEGDGSHDDLFKRIKEMAEIVGQGHYIVFVTNDTASLDALSDLLEREYNVYTKEDFELWRKQNNISQEDINVFNAYLREMRGNLLNAQVSAWYSYGAYTQGNYRQAEVELDIANFYLDRYYFSEDKVNGMFDSWEPLVKATEAVDLYLDA